MSGEIISEETLKELRDIQDKIFDKAASYTKAVLGLGYGGFFVLWSGTRHFLPARQYNVVQIIGATLAKIPGHKRSEEFTRS